MGIPGAKDEDGGDGHETWDINLRGVCVEGVGQGRVENDLWEKGENGGGGKRGGWSGGEGGEQVKQRGKIPNRL